MISPWACNVALQLLTRDKTSFWVIERGCRESNPATGGSRINHWVFTSNQCINGVCGIIVCVLGQWSVHSFHAVCFFQLRLGDLTQLRLIIISHSTRTLVFFSLFARLFLLFMQQCWLILPAIVTSVSYPLYSLCFNHVLSCAFLCLPAVSDTIFELNYSHLAQPHSLQPCAISSSSSQLSIPFYSPEPQTLHLQPCAARYNSAPASAFP